MKNYVFVKIINDNTNYSTVKLVHEILGNFLPRKKKSYNSWSTLHFETRTVLVSPFQSLSCQDLLSGQVSKRNMSFKLWTFLWNCVCVCMYVHIYMWCDTILGSIVVIKFHEQTTGGGMGLFGYIFQATVHLEAKAGNSKSVCGG